MFIFSLSLPFFLLACINVGRTGGKQQTATGVKKHTHTLDWGPTNRRESGSNAARKQQPMFANWLGTFVQSNCNDFLLFTVTVIGQLFLSPHTNTTTATHTKKTASLTDEGNGTKPEQIKLEAFIKWRHHHLSVQH